MQTIYIASYDPHPTIYQLQDNHVYSITPSAIPSFIIPYENYLFVANKATASSHGGVSVFLHSTNNQLKQIAHNGDDISYTHLYYDAPEQLLYAVSYHTGELSVFSFHEAKLIKLCTHILKGSGTDPHGRQQTAHPHYIHKLNNRIIVADLGANCVRNIDAHKLCYEDCLEEENSLTYTQPIGPRHCILTKDGKWMLLANELANSVMLYAYNQTTNQFQLTDTISLAPDSTQEEVITASIGAIYLNDEENEVIVSIRGNQTASFIHQLQFDTQKGKLYSHQQTQVHDHPRDISLWHDTLYVACMNDNCIDVLDLHTLSLRSTITNITKPVSICIMN